MATQDQKNSADQASRNAKGDPGRMSGVIDDAKGISTQDLQGRADKAQAGRDRVERAVENMSPGNTPRAGDDPQHLARNTMGQTPLATDTGGRGQRGKDPTKDQA